ncbi:hypothetical protein CDAR_546311 [Caerostris darwini]|uniref:Uncharacterized protein n=1 Tax=Caerostris darwini TaxID=1538125 RepID=A0AAV4RL12_9ARAC|nr:hypothetical protein CDAR_546311 [Caerostris darwini]
MHRNAKTFLPNQPCIKTPIDRNQSTTSFADEHHRRSSEVEAYPVRSHRQPNQTSDYARDLQNSRLPKDPSRPNEWMRHIRVRHIILNGEDWNGKINGRLTEWNGED